MSMLSLELDQALDSFKRAPGGDYWVRLQDAMYAYQFARGKDEDSLHDMLEHIGVGNWPSHLSKLVKEKV